MFCEQVMGEERKVEMKQAGNDARVVGVDWSYFEEKHKGKTDDYSMQEKSDETINQEKGLSLLRFHTGCYMR